MFLLTVLLVTTAFFASSLGLLIASFYSNIMQAFGAIYGFMMLMILPNIAYFMPSWVKIIPTYPMLEGFKSVLLGNGDWAYVLTISGGLLIAGVLAIEMLGDKWQKCFYWIPFYWAYKGNDLILSESGTRGQIFMCFGIVLLLSGVGYFFIAPKIRKGLE